MLSQTVLYAIGRNIPHLYGMKTYASRSSRRTRGRSVSAPNSQEALGREHHVLLSPLLRRHWAILIFGLATMEVESNRLSFLSISLDLLEC